MNDEKRKFARIKIQVDARYQHIIDDKATWITALVNNLSESGACILIDDFPLIGANILLRLRLPSNPKEWFQINTKVVDVDKYMDQTYLARLEFINLLPEYQNQIREYIVFCLK